MSDIETKTKDVVTTLKQSLNDMPSDMRIFSLVMRSLYSDKAVGTSSDAARNFRKLRDDTRQDAIVFLKCILPIFTKYVSSIQEYFQYYEALSYEQWCEMLPYILEETTTYKEIAQMLVEMYKHLMVDLKKREDEAKIIITEFKDLQREYEREKNKLEASASCKKKWALYLSFIPGISEIAVPLLNSLADKDSAEALAKHQQSKINEAAAIVVSEALIPALSGFIDGLMNTGGYFEVVEKELEKFQEQPEKIIESPKRLFYQVMKKEAKDMKSLCQNFYAVLPAVRTDFQVIPDEGTDQNYVDKWLKKTKADIEKKGSKIQKFVFDIFKRSEEKAK